MVVRAASRHIVIGLVGLLLISLWSGVAMWSWSEHERVLASHAVVLEQLTSAVEEQTRRLFKQAETSLMVCNQWIGEHRSVDPGSARGFVDLVERLRRMSDGLIDIRTVTASGALQYVPPRGTGALADVTDRDYFRAQYDLSTRGFFIAAPVLSRVTGKWGIPASIAVEPGGGAVEVLFAALELDRVGAAFDAERPKPDGSIAIVRSDGIFLFRAPLGQQMIGSSLANTPGWSEHLALSTHGLFTTARSVTDRRAQVVSFRRLPDYPLIVTVTSELDEVLASWRRQNAILVGVAGTITAACLLFAWALMRTLAAEQRSQQELARLIVTDSLTGVGNRRHLMHRLELEMLRAQRYQHHLTVVFFDVDHFKRVNDMHGHGVGDTVLVAVARALQANLRQVDVLGRLGGEEFAALLIETGIDGALPIAERMRAAVHQIVLPGLEAVVSVSAGLAEWQVGETGEALMARSDRALYQAKAAGRNCCRVAGQVS